MVDLPEPDSPVNQMQRGIWLFRPARAALFADRYGVLVYGAISGVLALVLTMSRAVVPLGVEIARPLFGDYAPIYLVMGVVTTIGSLLILVVPRLGRTKTGTTQS